MVLRINTDMAAGIFGLLFASLLWFPREEMGRLSIIFPRAILLITAVVSICIIVKGMISPGERKVEIQGNPVRLFVMIAVLLLWWYLIGVFGFITTTFFVFLGLVWYLARVDKKVSLKNLLAWMPIVALIVGFFYLAFTEVLKVTLPKGIFF